MTGSPPRSPLEAAWIPADRMRALVEAYEELDERRRGAQRPPIGAAIDRARRDGWIDVEFVLHHALLAQAMRAGADHREPFTRLAELAATAEDTALVVAVEACLARLHRFDGADPSPSADARLARAVAMLDDGAGSRLHRPIAWVECAFAYRAADLWELEEEMLAAAAAELDVPWPATAEPLRALTERVVRRCRLEARAQRVCERLVLDERAAAAELAQAGLALPGAVAPDPPADPAADPEDDGEAGRVAAGVRALLAAAARRPRPDPASAAGDPHAAARPGSAWCCLADAVRAADDGDVAAAARLGEAALTGLDSGSLPALRLLALALAARQPPRSDEATRYALELARLRAGSRHRLLDGAHLHRAHERLRRENHRLTAHAYVDQLTGLANRHAYARHLDRLRRGLGSDYVGVLVVDVDWFKEVNDTYGHGVGDQVLRRVAGILTTHVRAEDLVVRLGGDEFIVIFDAVSDEVVAARAEQMIHTVLGTTWDDVAAGLQVSVSAGFSIGPGRHVDMVIENADQSLYQAKDRGRGRLVAG